MLLSEVLVLLLFIFRPVDGISFEFLPMGTNLFDFILMEEIAPLFFLQLFIF